MEYIMILMCLFCLMYGIIIGIQKYRTWYNPITFFNLLYFLIIFFSSFRFFDYKPVSPYTYFLLLIGFLGYNYAVPLEPSIVGVKTQFRFGHSKSVKKKVWLCNIILFILFAGELANVSVLYVMDMDPQTIRGVYFEGNPNNLYGTIAFWELARNYIESPLMIAIFVISTIWLFLYKNWKQFLIAIFFIVSHVFVSYGRFIIAYVLIAMLVCYAMMSRYRVLTINKKYVKILIAIAVLSILYISLDRGVENFLGFLYEYFCGCVFLLDQLIEEIPEDFQNGAISFNAIIAPILTLAKQIFGIDYGDWYLRAISAAQVKAAPHVISETGQVTNAFSTPVFSLYADFGIIGVFLGMMLLSKVCIIIYRKAMKYMSERNLAFYLIVIINLFKTIQDYPFVATIFIFSLFYIWVIYKGDTC